VTLIEPLEKLFNAPKGTTVGQRTDSKFPSLTFCPVSYTNAPMVSKSSNSTVEDIYKYLPSLMDKMDVQLNLDFQYTLNR
jgi:hypothetical protein